MEDKLSKEHLLYFKNLLEGKAEFSLKAYLAKNEESLRKHISAPRFARLKFKTTDEVEKILAEEGVPYEIDPQAVRGEKYLATFHPDVLDENGRLKEDFKYEIFDGLIKTIKNNEKYAVLDFEKYIGLSKGGRDSINIEKLTDVEYFAEIEAKYGEKHVGVYLLQLISSIGRQFSEIDDIVLRAKEALSKID
ncbi:hypothetical protein C8237_01435 [Paracidovorax avenae]|uniref:hypothetical protein n=1 Tax=Paracidovorax avenae TaxID=80867 RepID=UPI000D2112E4|nr:hypothetical protein [Paracidovorax avenae]AVS79888.1 hypothetical protein C8237_01435 [Paracidovorax avenae]